MLQRGIRALAIEAGSPGVGDETVYVRREVGGQRCGPREADKRDLRLRIPAPERPERRCGRYEISEVETAEDGYLLYHVAPALRGAPFFRAAVSPSSSKAAPVTVSGAMPVRHSWPMGQTRL